MARDVLNVAGKLMRRRRFDKAIKLLEGRAEIYEGNFDYYLLTAVACLYVGDTGSASIYFQRARNIRLTDTNLLLGQAALFLRRGDTDRAIQYYIEILDNDPGNKIASRAMEFIRSKGDYDTICRWVDTGRIERFYPPLGADVYKIAAVALPCAACVLGVLLALLASARVRGASGDRADLSGLALSAEERKNAQEADLSSGAYAYILSGKQITESYEAALRYFQSRRDNAAQAEINRILNSNASVSVRQKASTLMSYLEPPSFDTIQDSPSYRQVEQEPKLYLDCWVSWSGRVSNVEQTDSLYRCDFLVGYDSLEKGKLEGIVPLRFAAPPVIEADKPLRVLARIASDSGRLYLEGRSVYQSVRDQLVSPSGN